MTLQLDTAHADKETMHNNFLQRVCDNSCKLVSKCDALAADDPLVACWNEWFEQLREFKAQFGHCRVSRREDSPNPKLGKWVTNQRQNYKIYSEGKPSCITVERIRELESVEFEWDLLADFWSVRFRDLCEFKVESGHCFVPLRYSPKPKLGRWVTKQRQYYKSYSEGKPSCLTAKRIKELESAGFVWDPIAFFWRVQFRQLSEFKAQSGHGLLPIRLFNPKLGKWVTKQRHDYKLYSEGKPSCMTAERIRELESVEFVWDPLADFWNVRFRELCEFRAQSGQYLVSLKSSNLKLAKWVTTQRHNYKLHSEGKPSHMTAERIRELESVEFVWDTKVLLFGSNGLKQLAECFVPI